jgi:hypothetical protein
MIIGTGMISQALSSIDNDRFLFFASGVSNSLETNPAAFRREADLLELWLRNCEKKYVVFHYFSTTGVEHLTAESREYFHHKKRMEAMILDAKFSFRKIIFRLPNVVGNSRNPYTLTNFIYSCVKSTTYHALHMEAQRELLDVAHLPRLILENIENSAEIIRAHGIRCSVADIVSAFRKDVNAPIQVQLLIDKYYEPADKI